MWQPAPYPVDPIDLRLLTFLPSLVALHQPPNPADTSANPRATPAMGTSSLIAEPYLCICSFRANPHFSANFIPSPKADTLLLSFFPLLHHPYWIPKILPSNFPSPNSPHYPVLQQQQKFPGKTLSRAVKQEHRKFFTWELTGITVS